MLSSAGDVLGMRIPLATSCVLPCTALGLLHSLFSS